MKRIFFLFFFTIITLLHAENLNYITAIKYKDFPKENFVRLVLFFVSPPPFFEIKKISEKKLKMILYNTDLTKYVPMVKVESAILSEIIPKQVKENVEVIFVFKKIIENFTYIKSSVPSLIYIKVRVSEFEEIPVELENKTLTGNVTAKLKPQPVKIKPQSKSQPKLKSKPKLKPKPKPKKIKIPKIQLDRAKQLYELGLSKMAEGDCTTAISIFNQLLSQFSKENPYYIKAQFRIADCYYKSMDVNNPHNIMSVIKIYFQLVTTYPKNPESSWAMFQIGNCYMKLGFYEEALASYKYVIKYAPKTIYVEPAKLNVAKILYKFKRYDEAIEYLQDIIKNYPNKMVAQEAYYKLGDCFVGKNDYKSALKYYEYAEKKWPDLLNKMPETLYNIGDTYFHLNKFGKAREYFLKIRSLFPKTSYVDIALLKIGETYLKEKNIENALYVYNRVIQITKDKNNEIIARLRMAQIGLEYPISEKLKKKYGYLVNPEKGFIYVIQNYPKNKLTEIAYSKLVKYYLKIKDYKSAVLYSEQFFSKYPLSEIRDLMKKNLQIALKGYFNNLFENENYFKILVYYEKYKQDFFQRVNDYNQFLKIALSMKKLFLLEKSNIIFKKLAKIAKDKNKEFLEFQIIENNYFLEKNVIQDINNFLKKYTNSNFRNKLLYFKAEIYKNKKNFYNALQIYKNLKDKKYKPFLINYKIAKLYQSFGYIKKANDYYNKLISFPLKENDIDSAVPDIYFQRAYTDYLLKNFKNAINEFNQFLEKFPDDKRIDEAYFYCAESYFELNNYQKALETFNYIIKNFKDSFWSKLSKNYVQKIKWITSNEKEFNN